MRHGQRLTGSIPALVTPFRNGELDLKAFAGLIEFVLDGGSRGVVPCGTTGEAPTLTGEEYAAIVQRCVDVVKGRVPVIAGTGTNDTARTIEMTRLAENLGADAALIVAPYYNKPTQEGLYAHFRAIHDATSLPLILYNIPGRSVVDMNVDTVLRLAELPRIVGLKDATPDLSRPTMLRLRLPEDFSLLSGEDATAAAFRAQGGDGCISVVANLAPRWSARLHESWDRGDLAGFAEARAALAPLSRALFLETSPAPVKYAGSLLGLCAEDVRLPLVPPGESCRAAVRDALAHAGLTLCRAA